MVKNSSFGDHYTKYNAYVYCQILQWTNIAANDLLEVMIWSRNR